MLSRAEIRGGLLVFGALIVLLLLVATFTPGVPGELLLQSLRFHIVALGVLTAVLAIAFGARWRGLVGLVLVLAAGIQGGMSLWELQTRRLDAAEPPSASFRFLSFNVLTGNDRSEELLQSIVDDPPDVALIMETPGIEPYLDRLAAVLPYRLGCDRTASCDISLYSRFPIENGRVITLQPFRLERLVIAPISVDGVKVTIVGTHLSKPYFDMASWGELVQVSEQMGRIEGPIVLAGDFNAAPWSDPLIWLARQQDLASGPWPPATWPVRLGPLGVPIDNMFTRGNSRILTL